MQADFLWLPLICSQAHKSEVTCLIASDDICERLINLSLLSIGLPIVRFKGTQVEFSKLGCISGTEGCFNLSKQCRPR